MKSSEPPRDGSNARTPIRASSRHPSITWYTMSVNVDKPVARLVEATADLLARQWRAIGGAAAGGAVRTQVDIEVLCLASMALERYEPRLPAILADWITLGASL